MHQIPQFLDRDDAEDNKDEDDDDDCPKRKSLFSDFNK